MPTNPYYTFALSDEQIVKLGSWLTEQAANAVATQKANPPDVPRGVLEDCWEMGYPYGGAIGGSTTFSFTPTSLGTCIKVTDGFTKETIDLTDYEDW